MYVWGGNFKIRARSRCGMGVFVYVRGVKLKARGPIPARRIILCGPREHMIVL